MAAKKRRIIMNLTGIRKPLLHKQVKPYLRHVALIIVTIIFMLPIYWMVISAFKENTSVFSVPIKWFPDPIRWQNFPEAFNYPGYPFLKFLWNSTFYSGMVTIGTVMSCSLSGYAFARLRFPGRNILFSLTIASLMI